MCSNYKKLFTSWIIVLKHVTKVNHEIIFRCHIADKNRLSQTHKWLWWRNSSSIISWGTIISVFSKQLSVINICSSTFLWFCRFQEWQNHYCNAHKLFNYIQNLNIYWFEYPFVRICKYLFNLMNKCLVFSLKGKTLVCVKL
jgi:hypothetical protein